LFLYYGQDAVASGNTANYYVKAPINLASGQNFTTNLGNDGTDVNYTVINEGSDAANITALQAINTNSTTLGGNYALGSNITLTTPSEGQSNWTPIGYEFDYGKAFTGRFDGLGHKVSNLTINEETQNIGFFGVVRYYQFNPEIKNIGIVNGTVTGIMAVGALVGNMDGIITNVYAKNVTVTGGVYVGGLIGYYGSDTGQVENSYATGDVIGGTYVGGLVGQSLVDISNSYATGDVTGNSVSGGLLQVGGLVGSNMGKTIQNSYATGSVTATSSGGIAGGLVGKSADNGSNIATILNSYATGSVTATTNGTAGGLVGANGIKDCSMGPCRYASGYITNSYSIGAVSGSTKGGLVGINESDDTINTITASFYDSTVNTGMSDSSYGKTATEFANPSTFSAWSNSIWSFDTDASVAGYELASRPYLTALGKDAGITSTTLFEGGFGTEQNPYTITTATQLQNMNNSNVLTNANYYYNLSNNLNLQDVTWTPIGNNTTKFAGKFDGLGHTVDHLTITNPSSDYQGLFGAIVSTGLVQNIGIINANITGKKNVGILAGYNGGTFSNVYTTGSVSGSSDIGGLVGYQNSGAILNSYSTGTVSSTAFSRTGGLVGINVWGTISNVYSTGNVSSLGNGSVIGGLVGRNNNGSITNAYSSGDVKDDGGNAYVGGLVGQYAYGTIANVYSTGSVSGASGAWVGGLIGVKQGIISNAYSVSIVSGGTNIGGLIGSNSGSINNSFYNSTVNSTGMSDTSYGKTATEFANADTFSPWVSSGVWSFTDASVAGCGLTSRPYLTSLGKDTGITTSSSTLFAGGFGTEQSPYTITSATQLQNMNNSDVVSQADYYYNLSDDLDLSTYLTNGVTWTPIGNSTSKFAGKFDGLGHTISNLTINASSNMIGLFGYTNSFATINNLGLVDVDIQSSEGYLGGLVGFNNGAISKAYVTGSVSGKDIIGGLVGFNGGTITDSYSATTVTGSSSGIGGLVGWNIQGDISNTYSTGVVTGIGEVGGLVGTNAGSIDNSFWNTETSGQSTSAGGVGKTTAEMQKIATYTTNITNEDDRWTMTLDETQKKIYPYLTYNSQTGTSSWTIGKYATALNYTLGEKESTYSGLDQLLGGFWTNSIFGSARSSLVAGTDYKFVYGSDYVTSFKNAGTYNGVSVVLLNADYELEGTPTYGTLIISKANATVTAASDSKVYNGLTQTVSGFTASGLVNNETESVLSGITGASASGKNVGEYVTVLDGTDSNYNLTFVNGKLIISKVNLTVTAKDDSIVEGSRVYSSGKGVDYSGFVDGEKENVLGGNLIYAGTSQGAKLIGNYIISIKGLESENYTITYVDGKLIITPDATKIVPDKKETDIPSLGTTGTSGDTTPNNFVDILKDVEEKGGERDPFAGNKETTTQKTDIKPSIPELKEKGTPAVELKNQGYKAIELKDGGYTAKELKDAGYSITELKEAGFSQEDLKSAGFTSLQLKRAGF
jgi:hypothetical protein